MSGYGDYGQLEEGPTLLEVVLAWCFRHWPVVAGFVAAIYVCDHLMLLAPTPVRWFWFWLLVGGSAAFDVLYMQPWYAGGWREAARQVPQQMQQRDEPRHGQQPQGPGPYRLTPCAELWVFTPEPGALDREIIGLEEAKRAIREAIALILGRSEEARRMRDYGVTPPKGILLYGPPGTGKTSFARAAAKEFGCYFIVVNASAVAGKYVGETEKNIRDIFAWARCYARSGPVVVFWDEIDAIAQARGSGNLGSELAINTLLTELDGFAGLQGVVLIAATNRADRLDPALTRPGRIDVRIEVGLPDEKARREIFRLYLSRYRALTEQELAGLAAACEGISPSEIREVCNEAARRAAREGAFVELRHLEEALRSVTGRGGAARRRPAAEVWRDIDSLVGLGPVKEFLREVEAVVLMSRQRRERGLPPLKQSLHMAFLGNPGTGKTTVARLAGELLAALGALPSGHMVEVDRSGLVAGYVGQTALKVQEVVQRAMGGVLFVDEAYSLARGAGTGYDFGAEALDALVKAMEDHRDRLCVILAGYEREMQELFEVNPGLRSRIAFTCRFPDYSPEECLEVARREAARQAFRLSPDAEQALLARFRTVDLGAAGNGRYARRLVEAAIRRQAVRAAEGRAADLVTLEACDFEGVE